MYRIPFLVTLIWIIISPVFADESIRTFEESFTYVLTDNDSKNDARRICFLKAKDKVVTSIKTYLKDILEKENKYQISSEDIDMLIHTLLYVDTKEEKWNYSEESVSVLISVTAEVDVQYFLKRLFYIKKDEALQKKIIDELKELKKKEQDYLAFKEELAKANSDTAILLRKERQTISTELDKLEKVKYIISSKTKSVAEKIQPGMTVEEVVDIAGQPRATATCDKPDFLNYGKIWISVRNGIVTGTIPLEKWSGPCGQSIGRNNDDNAQSQKKSDAKNSIPEEKAKFVIVLKNGQRIPTPIYYQVEDVIYYKRYGGIIGVEEKKIKEIIEVE